MKTLFKAITLLLNFVAFAAAQSGAEVVIFQNYDFPEIGAARAYSMAGSYTAFNTGVDAINGNPAGLAGLEQAHFIGSGAVSAFGKIQYDDQFLDDNYFQSFDLKMTPMPQLRDIGMAFPVTMGTQTFAGAVAYRTVYPMGSTLESEITEEFGDQEKFFLENKGRLATLTVGCAGNVNERFKIGGSFNFALPSQHQISQEEQIIPADQNDPQEQTEYNVTSDIVATNFFQLGAQFTVSPKVDIGFSMMTAHEIEFEDTIVEVNWDGIEDRQEQPDSKYTVPALYSFGFAYKLRPQTILTAQMDNQPWEKVELDGYEYGEEDAYAYRFGFEHNSNLTLRAGYAVRKEANTNSDNDPVYSHLLTGGLGLKTGNMIIDAGVQYRRLKTDFYDSGSTYDLTTSSFSVFLTVKHSFDFTLNL